MRECVCNECGMEFTVDRLDTTKDTMKCGHEVEVISFTCPKCNEKFIVAVRDEESARLQDKFQAAQEEYRNGYNIKDENKLRKLRNEVKYSKRSLMVYMDKLRKRYLKELRKRGK